MDKKQTFGFSKVFPCFLRFLSLTGKAGTQSLHFSSLPMPIGLDVADRDPSQ